MGSIPVTRVRTATMAGIVAITTITTAAAVSREAYREIRARYEGMSLRLRVDLRPATLARPPNVVSRQGVGYGREKSPVLFHRLERVYLERLTSDGARRLGLTVYRNEEEARQLRALAIPQPSAINPGAGGTLAAFARLGSTSVLLELEMGKGDPTGQRHEIDALLARLFYIDSEPGRADLESFVEEHRGASIGWLHAHTGLETEEIRRLVDRPASR